MENLQTNILQQNFDLAEKKLIDTDLRVTSLDHIRSFFKAGLDFHASQSEPDAINLWKEALSELDEKRCPKSALSIIRDKMESHWDDSEFQPREAFLRVENLVSKNYFNHLQEQTHLKLRPTI